MGAIIFHLQQFRFLCSQGNFSVSLLKCRFGGQKHSSCQLPEYPCASKTEFAFRQFYSGRRARALKHPLGCPVWAGDPGCSAAGIFTLPTPNPASARRLPRWDRTGQDPAAAAATEWEGREEVTKEEPEEPAGRSGAESPPSGGRCSAPLARPARGCRERLHALGPAVRSRGGAQPGGGSGARGGRPRPAAVAAHGSAGGRAAEACGPLALPEAAAPAGEGARRRRPLLRRRQQLRLRVGGAAVAAPAPRRLPAGGCYGPLGERRGLPGLEVSAAPAPRRLLLR